MTKTNPLTFDEIATEYGRHWDALEDARTLLLTQRDQILDEFAQRIESALSAAETDYAVGHQSNGGYATRYFEINGKFAQAKRDQQVKVKYLDGVQVASRSGSSGALELSVELYFRMGRRRHARLRSAIRDLEHHGFDPHYESSYLIIPRARITLGEEDHTQEFLTAIEELPQTFDTADAALAAAVRMNATETE